MENSIYHSKIIYNFFMKMNLCQSFSHTVIKHMLTIIISSLSLVYKGKIIDFEAYSPCHRTTIAYFFNKGKWDDNKLENILKSAIINTIYNDVYDTSKKILSLKKKRFTIGTNPEKHLENILSL